MNARSALSLLPLVLLTAAGCRTSQPDPITRGAATPQRPTFYSSTATTAVGTMELEAGYETAPSDGDRSVPTTLKFGLSQNSELFFDWPVYEKIDTPGGGTASGVGDVSVGMRQRLLDEDAYQPAIALQAKTKIPAGSNDPFLTNDGIDFFGAIAVDKNLTWGQVIGFYELGFLSDPTGRGTDLQHLLSGGTSHRLDEQFGLFSELAFFHGVESGHRPYYVTGGGQYFLDEHTVFDAGLRFGLNSDAQEWVFLIGVTTNFGDLFSRYF
jgi:hypothetical protein